MHQSANDLFYFLGLSYCYRFPINLFEQNWSQNWSSVTWLNSGVKLFPSQCYNISRDVHITCILWAIMGNLHAGGHSNGGTLKPWSHLTVMNVVERSSFARS